MTRRHFVKLLLLLMVYGLIQKPDQAEASTASPKSLGAFPIIQGATDATTTQVAILIKKTDIYSYRLRICDEDQESKEVLPVTQERFGRESSDFALDQIRFEGLDVQTGYFFEVLSLDGQVLDQRELRTLDLENTATPFHVLSCMRDNKNESETDAIWDSLISTKPAIMFWLGDNCYASFAGSVSPDQLWKRNVDTRQTFKIFKDRRLVPVIAIWDDHDYGSNDGDSGYEHKDSALETFQAFFPQKEIPGSFTRGPANSSHLKAFGQEFFFMDGRFHKRQTNRAGESSQWGDEGEQWLFERLDQAQGPIWISNGTMFFKTFPICESFEKQFKPNFKSMMARLQNLKHPVLFMSGDIHMSMISRVPEKYMGYNTYEITSSGLLSFRGPVFFTPPSKRRVAGVYKNNFVQIRPLAVHPRQIAAEVTAFGNKRKIHFREYIAVSK